MPPYPGPSLGVEFAFFDPLPGLQTGEPYVSGVSRRKLTNSFEAVRGCG